MARLEKKTKIILFEWHILGLKKKHLHTENIHIIC